MCRASNILTAMHQQNCIELTKQDMMAGLTRMPPQKAAGGGVTAGSRMISSFHAARATNQRENSALRYSSLCCTASAPTTCECCN